MPLHSRLTTIIYACAVLLTGRRDRDEAQVISVAKMRAGVAASTGTPASSNSLPELALNNLTVVDFSCAAPSASPDAFTPLRHSVASLNHTDVWKLDNEITSDSFNKGIEPRVQFVYRLW
jgi:hypothetical protein